MSNFKYEFKLGIGYHGAEWSDVFDMVDDGGYDESYLEGLSKWDLDDVVYGEAEEWAQTYIEVSAERVDD